MNEKDVRWFLAVAFTGSYKQKSQVQAMLSLEIRKKGGDNLEGRIHRFEEYYMAWVEKGEEVNDVVVARVMELIS